MDSKEYLTNKNFCPMPWTGFMYNFDGMVKNCIRNPEPIGNLKDNSITEILHGEVNLTTNTIPKATAANTVGDSLLTDSATTLSYNTNKFQVTASDGATLIAGNVTVSAAGGADGGTKTSAIVFRNSSNVLGYVSTTETTDVLDGILGYKNSDGALKFSTVIDGGTY